MSHKHHHHSKPHLASDSSPATPINSDSRPPAYSNWLEDFSDDVGEVEADGRLDIDLNPKLVRVLSALHSRTDLDSIEQLSTVCQQAPIHLNIVIQIVGSRGDVQPFVALGHELKQSGHRIRIATHNVFREFVTSSGLEFYPIGGDPNELMAYMVRNPGLIPKMKSLREGEITKKRAMIAEMLEGCWDSCIAPDDVTGAPFVADAIIANPPSFAHIHCAETLGIPVHLMFTMPWTATKAFPHPLVDLKSSKVPSGAGNLFSYGAVEWLTWQGIGDLVNWWRITRDLEPVPHTEGPWLPYTLQIPTTYCWSESLVPKPADWGKQIDVCGFFFREPPEYEPPADLAKFLEAGDAPIYIGFGSIVAEDPALLTAIIGEAVKRSGVRCLLSRGWSKLGEGLDSPDIFLLGDCPHEWLFQKVTAVIHHGGAGTTACGLRFGRPTAVVPFFGDQPFWGNMIANAGAGPAPIHHKSLTADKLVAAISVLLTPEAAQAAQAISEKMAGENGVTAAVNSFVRHLPSLRHRCQLIPHFVAAWKYKTKRGTLRLSKPAVEILVNAKKIDATKLELYETRPVYIEKRHWEPLTAGVSAALGGVYDAGNYVTSIGKKEPTSARQAQGEQHDAFQKTAKSATLQAGRAFGALVRAGAVDTPYAFAQGFHNGPRLYGERPRDFGHITDWKSGGVIAGKSLVYGLYDGITGLVTEPIKGARKEGALGAAKGMGTGVLGLYFKGIGGLAAVLGYPLQGLFRTAWTFIHTKTKKEIAVARRLEGAWLVAKAEKDKPEAVQDVLVAYEKFLERHKHHPLDEE